MSTKLIEVNGLLVAETSFKKGNVIVRFTSDNIGETLSLSFEDKIMITVPFEKIDKLIQQTRSENNAKRNQIKF